MDMVITMLKVMRSNKMSYCNHFTSLADFNSCIILTRSLLLFLMHESTRA